MLRRVPGNRFVALTNLTEANLDNFDPIAAYDREKDKGAERPLMQVIIRVVNGQLRVFGVNRDYRAEGLDLRGVPGKVASLYERFGSRLQGGEAAGGWNRQDFKDASQLPTPEEAFTAIEAFLRDMAKA